MKSADELSEQIALVADIENTCRYPDVAGKWQTTRRELMSNPRIRCASWDVQRRQLHVLNEIVSTAEVVYLATKLLPCNYER